MAPAGRPAVAVRRRRPASGCRRPAAGDQVRPERRGDPHLAAHRSMRHPMSGGEGAWQAHDGDAGRPVARTGRASDRAARTRRPAARGAGRPHRARERETSCPAGGAAEPGIEAPPRRRPPVSQPRDLRRHVDLDRPSAGGRRGPRGASVGWTRHRPYAGDRRDRARLLQSPRRGAGPPRPPADSAGRGRGRGPDSDRDAPPARPRRPLRRLRPDRPLPAGARTTLWTQDRQLDAIAAGLGIATAGSASRHSGGVVPNLPPHVTGGSGGQPPGSQQSGIRSPALSGGPSGGDGSPLPDASAAPIHAPHRPCLRRPIAACGPGASGSARGPARRFRPSLPWSSSPPSPALRLAGIGGGTDALRADPPIPPARAAAGSGAHPARLGSAGGAAASPGDGRSDCRSRREDACPIEIHTIAAGLARTLPDDAASRHPPATADGGWSGRRHHRKSRRNRRSRPAPIGNCIVRRTVGPVAGGSPPRPGMSLRHCRQAARRSPRPPGQPLTPNAEIAIAPPGADVPALGRPIAVYLLTCCHQVIHKAVKTSSKFS